MKTISTLKVCYQISRTFFFFGSIRLKVPIKQLVAQHCFVSSFGSIFRVFHLRRSTRTTNICVADWRKLLQKVERGSILSNIFSLCCSFFHETHNLSWIHTKQINQSARCSSSTRNNKCFVARQDDHARWKTRKIDQNLPRNKWMASRICRLSLVVQAAFSLRWINLKPPFYFSG